MKFAWIHEHQGVWPTGLLCRTLKAARSGYYAWLGRPRSARARRREELVGQIRLVHEQSRRVYGSPRVHRELLGRGVRCSKNTVARLMRENDLYSRTKRRFRVTTTDSRHDHAIAPNTLDQSFRPPAPNRVWAADITYLPTREGWLYLAVVIDLFSRRVIGWATADHLRASLAIDALTMALDQRRPTDPRTGGGGGGGGLLHHSDRGVQYACDSYRAVLDAHGIAASMSRTGNCYDNAVVESFFKSLKTEWTHHHDYATRAAARQSVFEYLEVFYNRQRRHSSLGYVSPVAFEQSAA